MADCPLCGCRIFRSLVRDLGACADCGLRRRETIPTVEELKERTKNFQLSAASKKMVRKERLENARHQMKLLDLKSPGWIYDVGAAAGFFLKVARDDGWEVGGNEISRAAIEWARKHYAIDLDYGILEETAPTRSLEHWGVVVIWNTLEHCIDPLTTLQAAHRMLLPGGVLLVSVPAKRTAELEKTYAGAHLSEFTPETLELCALMAGFKLNWLRLREARHCRQVDGRWTKS